jgi:hypothetical protein
MKLSELIAAYRSDTRDDVSQRYLASDDDVIGWLNEAEEEAALRKRLLFESTNATLCRIAVQAAAAAYRLPEGWFEITRATFLPTGSTEDPFELDIRDRVELDRIRPLWRTTSEEPRDIIVDDTKVQLGCLPDTAGLIQLEGYRAPLTPMKAENDAPEIGRAHHRHLIHWARYRNYNRPDVEVFDLEAAEKAKAEFARYFGERPDADMRRDFQANKPQHNKAYW